MSRAVRNNNPLNLRQSINDWLGKIKEPTDNEFEQFETWILGLRASLVNIRTHIKRGNNTVRKLVSVWAPATENDTNNYMNFVSKESGFDLDDEISFEIQTIKRIVVPMVKMESGRELTEYEFQNAWKLL